MSTNLNKYLIDTLKVKPLVPLFYQDSIDKAKHIIEACYVGGVRVIEFTNRGEKALHNFQELKAWKDTEFSDLILGIGTIKSVKEVQDFTSASAQFIVSPFLDKATGKFCVNNHIPWIPGCSTLTEMNYAFTHGACMVKAFPAHALGGSKFIKSVLAPCPELKIMASGGINATPNEVKEYLDNGAYCIGLGSSLFKDTQENNALLTKRCQQLLNLNL